MIARAIKVYEATLSDRAAEERMCQQRLFQAQSHRRNADAKCMTARLVKHHVVVLIDLAVQGLFDSKNQYDALRHDSSSRCFGNDYKFCAYTSISDDESRRQ
jgi:hypothetical protein